MLCYDITATHPPDSSTTTSSALAFFLSFFFGPIHSNDNNCTVSYTADYDDETVNNSNNRGTYYSVHTVVLIDT